MIRRLELTVGGEKIPLNKFTRVVIINTLLGLLKSLTGLNLKQEISIKVAAEGS